MFLVASGRFGLRLTLCAACCCPSLGTRANPAVTINVDAAASRRPINPKSTGCTRHRRPTERAEQPAQPARRQQHDPLQLATERRQRANDMVLPCPSATASAVAGERGDTFFAASRAAGAQPMLTVPLIGWSTARANASKLAGFSIAKYGAQTATTAVVPGRGQRHPHDLPVRTGNDPNDANVPSTAASTRLVSHLVNRWGTNAGGGLRYYILDNEHSIGTRRTATYTRRARRWTR